VFALQKHGVQDSIYFAAGREGVERYMEQYSFCIKAIIFAEDNSAKYDAAYKLLKYMKLEKDFNEVQILAYITNNILYETIT